MASATHQGLGEMGMCPGKQLQLSRQWLSLPQAPFPEAWLKAHWQGRSMLAASKWTAAPPMPALPPIRAQPLRQRGHPWAHSTTAMVPVLSGPGWEGLVPLWCGFAQLDKNTHACYLLASHPDMRRDVQEIFRLTPHEKQCMMFSATLSKEIRPVCRKFMQDVSRVTPQLAGCLPTVANTSA